MENASLQNLVSCFERKTGKVLKVQADGNCLYTSLAVLFMVELESMQSEDNTGKTLNDLKDNPALRPAYNYLLEIADLVRQECEIHVSNHNNDAYQIDSLEKLYQNLMSIEDLLLRQQRLALIFRVYINAFALTPAQHKVARYRGSDSTNAITDIKITDQHYFGDAPNWLNDILTQGDTIAHLSKTMCARYGTDGDNEANYIAPWHLKAYYCQEIIAQKLRLESGERLYELKSLYDEYDLTEDEGPTCKQPTGFSAPLSAEWQTTSESLCLNRKALCRYLCSILTPSQQGEVKNWGESDLAMPALAALGIDMRSLNTPIDCTLTDENQQRSICQIGAYIAHKGTYNLSATYAENWENATLNSEEAHCTLKQTLPPVFLDHNYNRCGSVYGSSYDHLGIEFKLLLRFLDCGNGYIEPYHYDAILTDGKASGSTHVTKLIQQPRGPHALHDLPLQPHMSYLQLGKTLLPIMSNAAILCESISTAMINISTILKYLYQRLILPLLMASLCLAQLLQLCWHKSLGAARYSLLACTRAIRLTSSMLKSDRAIHCYRDLSKRLGTLIHKPQPYRLATQKPNNHSQVTKNSGMAPMGALQLLRRIINSKPRTGRTIFFAPNFRGWHGQSSCVAGRRR